ncbi:MAG: hypothetical protein H0U74_04740 [Bradymonadaceae bacterium]|nr:hypothetical protein [Lujinxingiaceae bacterium]
MKTAPKRWLGIAAFVVTSIAVSSPAVAQPLPNPVEVLARFAHEPGITAVQSAALEYAGLADPDLDAWSARARWSNAIPRLQAQMAWLDQRDVQLRYRETFSTDDEGVIVADPNQSNLADDARFRTLFSLRASLDLGGLVYDRSEPIIAREVRSRFGQRDDVLRRVTELYFARRGKQAIRHLTPIANWERHLELELEIQAQTAQLDALTGGWFVRQLARPKTGAP